MESETNTRKLFGVRTKLLLLLGCLLFFFLTVAGVSLIGLYRIHQSASVIVDREAPFVRSIEEALFALIQAEFAAERILDLDDASQGEEHARLKENFAKANDRFKMFMSAITWGSETDAFKQSDGGKNYQLWVRDGFEGTLIVQESSATQAEIAGRIDIYFGGYVNNIQKAIEDRERYIAQRSKNSIEAEQIRASSKDYQIKARRLADLTVEHLREMIALSNETTKESARELRETEDNVQGITFIVSAIGLLVSVAIGISFAEKIIVEPILTLTNAARAFGSGNFAQRVTVQSRDELALLGEAFNAMADKLSKYTAELQEEVAKRTRELDDKIRELKLANDQLQELDKAKSEFISVAAHQLRTPLSALKWILGILIDENSENFTPEQKSLLFKGHESNERMISLINEMLVVTRIESGKARFEFVPTHIEDIIDSVTLDFSVQARVRKIQLAFQRPPATLPYISADPEKIRNVLQNLIENAIRYTPDEGSITISAATRGSLVEVSVQDTGIGIPEKQKTNIFSKFFRADNAVKYQTDGSGLGLFIAKSMVEKHGGSMTFESAEGKGTTFRFTIPVSTEQQKA